MLRQAQLHAAQAVGGVKVSSVTQFPAANMQESQHSCQAGPCQQLAPRIQALAASCGDALRAQRRGAEILKESSTPQAEPVHQPSGPQTSLLWSGSTAAPRETGRAHLAGGLVAGGPPPGRQPAVPVQGEPLAQAIVVLDAVAPLLLVHLGHRTLKQTYAVGRP